MREAFFFTACSNETDVKECTLFQSFLLRGTPKESVNPTEADTGLSTLIVSLIFLQHASDGHAGTNSWSIFT